LVDVDLIAGAPLELPARHMTKNAGVWISDSLDNALDLFFL
jgi:hypothetical protein